MTKIPEEVVHFFQNQGFVIISTVDKNNFPHNSCKGIVEIKQTGVIYLLDLYHGNTYRNLKNNPRLAVTAVEEHKFRGYSLTGTARILAEGILSNRLAKAWEDRINSRLTQRLIRNISGEKGYPRHPEVLLPEPEYLIEMQVENVLDLAPAHIKQGV